MAVTIGHASIDERGKAAGGVPGDQTGKEVCVRSWYSKPWSAVFRAKDPAAAEKIALSMEAACSNGCIGYDQSARTSLYTLAKEKDWDLSKIVDNCACDCSSLVAVCVNAAGIRVDAHMYTGSQQQLLQKTGAFTVLTAREYTDSPDRLKRGDILLGTGHTAVVLCDGGALTAEPAEVEPAEPARNFLRSWAGTYQVTADLLNVRAGAGITKKILTTIAKGTKVRCYGYYTAASGRHWLCVQFTRGGVTYTGFASEKYLKKL